MPKDSVRIACVGASVISIDLLSPLQGRLKVLPEQNYKKLRAEILADGFIEAVSVWEDPASSKVYVLNGHQRLETLRRMKGEGHKIPQIPVNYVEADDIADAKRKILALASQYGVVDQEGLFDFVQDAGLDAVQIRERYEFSDFDTERFLKEHFGAGSQPATAGAKSEVIGDELGGPDEDEPEATLKSSEVDPTDFDTFDHQCPRCQFEFND